MEFDLIAADLDAYCTEHTSAEPQLLARLNRDTHVNVLKPRMLSGHFQGRLLSMLSKMIQPEYILEIGTYTGYSALCLAEGLKPTGKLITLDVNEQLEDFTRSYFDQSDFAHQIDYRICDAMQEIPKLQEPFDLVFIDADKQNYINYYHLVIDQLKSGAYILIDNVLWSGKVYQQSDKPDKDTRILREFNDLLVNDERVETILLPIRDGIMLTRKK